MRQPTVKRPTGPCLVCGADCNLSDTGICFYCALAQCRPVWPTLQLALESRAQTRVQYSLNILVWTSSLFETDIVFSSSLGNTTIIKACEFIEKTTEHSRIQFVAAEVHRVEVRGHGGKNKIAQDSAKEAAELRAAFYQEANGCCLYCKKPLGEIWDLDMIIPCHLEHSGPKIAWYRMLRKTQLGAPSCPTCNAIKARHEQAGINVLKGIYNGVFKFKVPLVAQGSIPCQPRPLLALSAAPPPSGKLTTLQREEAYLLGSLMLCGLALRVVRFCLCDGPFTCVLSKTSRHLIFGCTSCLKPFGRPLPFEIEYANPAVARNAKRVADKKKLVTSYNNSALDPKPNPVVEEDAKPNSSE